MQRQRSSSIRIVPGRYPLTGVFGELVKAPNAKKSEWQQFLFPVATARARHAA